MGKTVLSLLLILLTILGIGFMASRTNKVLPTQVSPSGSWNNLVTCIPQVTTISTITAGLTGNMSFQASPFTPGITNSPYGADAAKRWLTPSDQTPSGWMAPGPSCQFFVELDNVVRGSPTYQDMSRHYQYSNGASTYPMLTNCGSTGWCGDYTFNICDLNITLGDCDSDECASSSDITCTGRIHVEIDQDWLAAGYCGLNTTCWNGTIANGVKAVTRYDLQGFVFWDPDHLTTRWHSYNGWELHPVTAIRIHQVNNSTDPPGGAGGGRRPFEA